MTTKLDRAYIAGFLDGEGSIILCRKVDSHSGKLYLYPRVVFYNQDKPVLEWIRSKVGGTIQIMSKAGKSPINGYLNKRDNLALILSPTLSRTLCVDLLPYLKIKHEKAQNLSTTILTSETVGWVHKGHPRTKESCTQGWELRRSKYGPNGRGR